MFSCFKCKCRYTRLDEMQQHYASREENGPYPCDYCLFKSCTQKGLNFHRVVAHKVNNQVEIYEVEDEDQDSREAKSGSRSHQENISPLILAVQNRQIEIAKDLIQKCSNLTEVVVPFQIAIKTLQVEMVECFIENWTTCNLIHQLDRTILNQIVLSGSDDNTNCLKMIDLINENCDPSLIEEFHHHNESPLQLAVKRNMLNMTKYLLRNGAKVNQGSEESNPMMLATKNDNTEMVKVLLEHGANVNINTLDDVEYVPLFIAIKNDNIEMVKFLLLNGASIDMEVDGGKRLGHCIPLEYAICIEIGSGIRPNNLNIINLLLEYTANVNANDGCTITHLAASFGRHKLLQILLEQGANINQKDWEGSTPLHRAIKMGQDITVKELIMLGANLNLQDKKGQTPLLVAVHRGSEGIVKELILHGANVNLKDDIGISPLHWCFIYRYYNLAKSLLDNKADMNLIGRNTNQTLIFELIHNQKVDGVKLLVEHGVDLHQKSQDGKSVLEYAKAVGQKEIIQIVVEQLIKNSETKAKNEEPPAKRSKFDEDCVICYNPRNGIFVMTPCGHAKTCETCCMKIIYLPESNLKCPVCRVKVDSYIKAFY